MGKINFALIGCGRISYKHIEALVNNFKYANLYAVCDNNIKKKKKKYNEYIQKCTQKDYQFIKPQIYLYAVLVFITAFSGGIFQIPNLSMLQNAGLGRKLGDMIAYLNLVTFVFILFGSLLFSLTTSLFNQNSYLVFGLILVICILVGFYFLLKSPVYLTEMLKTLKLR